MLDVNDLSRHGSSAVEGIFVSTRRTETALASEGDKFPLPAVRATIHCAAVGRIAAVDHLVHVFYHRFTWMQDINHFFVMIRKDLLENVHKTIMKESNTKENPTPLMIEGAGGVEVSKTLFYRKRGSVESSFG